MAIRSERACEFLTTPSFSFTHRRNACWSERGSSPFCRATQTFPRAELSKSAANGSIDSSLSGERPWTCLIFSDKAVSVLEAKFFPAAGSETGVVGVTGDGLPPGWIVVGDLLA